MKIIKQALVALLIWYGIFSFIAMSGNIFEWHWIIRLIFVILIIATWSKIDND